MEETDKILVIEDEEEVRNFLLHSLQREGYEVVGVPSGPAAVEKARESKFDLVIADVKLPGDIDGIDAVQSIKAMAPERKVSAIIVTGYKDYDMSVKAIKAGVDDFIIKPVDLQLLIHSIRKNLKICHLEREKENYIAEIQKMNQKLASYNEKLESKVKQRTNELIFLFEVGRELTSSLELKEVLNTIVERTADMLEADICSIVLYDDKNDYLYVAAAKGLPEEIVKSARMKMGEKISGWVLEKNESILVEDIEHDERFSKRNHERYYTGSFVSASLSFKGKKIGVINVSNKRSRQIFTMEELRLLEGLSDQAAIAIENARLYANLKDTYIQIVSTLTSIIEMKDHYTGGHSQRVTVYATSIAKTMGLPEDEVEKVRLACQLHDLGKICISENILTKPGKLTEQEWEEIKLHPLRGVEILKPLIFLSDVIRLIEEHHERYDGKGYPYGRNSGDIPLGARIIAVADSFDAMTTERPYRPAFSVSEAVEELRRCRGTQFDPEVVDAFLRIIEEDPDFFQKHAFSV